MSVHEYSLIKTLVKCLVSRAFPYPQESYLLYFQYLLLLLLRTTTYYYTTTTTNIFYIYIYIFSLSILM
jgi:hypothetical protein